MSLRSFLMVVVGWLRRRSVSLAAACTAAWVVAAHLLYSNTWLSAEPRGGPLAWLHVACALLAVLLTGALPTFAATLHRKPPKARAAASALVGATGGLVSTLVVFRVWVRPGELLAQSGTALDMGVNFACRTGAILGIILLVSWAASLIWRRTG